MCFFFFQAEDGIRDAQESRGLGDVYKRQVPGRSAGRQDLEAEFLLKGPGKRDQAGLVVDADQGSSGVVLALSLIHI